MALTIDGSDPSGDLGDLLDAKRDASLPVGKILQVVAAGYSTQTLSTSATFAATGLTATITPSSAASKILGLVVQTGISKDAVNTSVKLRYMRDATVLATRETNAAADGTAGFLYVGASGINFLDSPNTTSSVTYSTQFASVVGGATVYVQSSTTTSTIVLMEVAA